MQYLHIDSRVWWGYDYSYAKTVQNQCSHWWLVNKGTRTPSEALHVHPPTHPPPVYYLPCCKKGTLCSVLALKVGIGRRWCVTESFNIHESLGYWAASSCLELYSLKGLNDHSEWLYNIWHHQTIVSFSISLSFLHSPCSTLECNLFPHFSTMVVSRSMCLPGERWHAGKEGVNAMTRTLRHLGLATVGARPPSRRGNAKNISCIRQGGWTESWRRSVHATKRTPPSHLCRIVIVFPWHLVVPLATWRLALGLFTCSLTSMAVMLKSNSDVF